MAESFETLLDEALADPEGADYEGLREAYACSKTYLPYGRDEGRLEELHLTMADEDWEQARALCEVLLEHDPVSIPLRFAYAHILEAEGDEWEAGSQRAFGNGMLRSILQSGDGRTPKTAMHVMDQREMYLVLDVMGLRAIRSRIEHREGEWLDLVEARGKEGDREVYFNVTIPQEWLAEFQCEG